MKKDLAKTILSKISDEEIVAMCCDVVNIPSEDIVQVQALSGKSCGCSGL